MKVRLFSVYDTKTEFYNAPFPAITKGQGERRFVDLLQEQQLEFSKHKDDYNLIEIGSFDQVTGLIEPLKTGPQVIITGEAVRRMTDAA